MACNFCRVTPVSPCPVCEAKPAIGQQIRRKASPRPAIASKPVTPSPAPAPASIARPAPAQPSGIDSSRATTVREVPAVGSPPFPAPMALLVRQAWEQGQVSLAGYRMTAVIADRAEEEATVAVLDLIDCNAKLRGFITESDAKLRARLIEGMAARWVSAHGFDPRFARVTTEVRPGHGFPPDANRTIVAAPAPACGKCGEHHFPGVATCRTPRVVLAKMVPGDWAELNRRVADGALTREQGLLVKAEWDAMAKATDDILADLLAVKA